MLAELITNLCFSTLLLGLVIYLVRLAFTEVKYKYRLNINNETLIVDNPTRNSPPPIRDGIGNFVFPGAAYKNI